MQVVLAGEQLTEHEAAVGARHLVAVVARAAEREKHARHRLVRLRVNTRQRRYSVHHAHCERRQLLVREVQTVRRLVEHVTLAQRLQRVSLRPHSQHAKDMKDALGSMAENT